MRLAIAIVSAGLLTAGLALGQERPRLALDEPCVAADTSATVRGSGFPPGRGVDVVSRGDHRHVKADADGRFAVELRFGQSMDQRRPAVHRIRVAALSGGRVEDVVAQPVATTAARATPRAGAASTIARWRLTGLAPAVAGLKPGRTVYAHWLRAGQHVASTRFAIARGPCGAVTTRRPLLPRGIARPGRWRVRFDNRRQFLHDRPGYAETSVRVSAG